MLRSAQSGDVQTGLSAASAGAKGVFTRAGGTPSSFALAALANDTAPWQAGGFIELDPVNNAGMYRLDVPNGAFIVGAPFTSVSLYFTGVLGEAVIVMIQAASTAVGPGGSAYTATVERSDTSAPIAGASLWITTDQAGANVIAGTLSTNAQGAATFQLQAGGYFLWTYAQGFNATNPAPITVTGAAGGATFLVAPSTAVVAAPPVTTHQARFTAHDLQDQLIDFLGADPGENAVRIARRAMGQAMREFATAARWVYLIVAGRLFMNGQYATGTIAFQAGSGTFPNEVTLTPDPVLGGAWPAWARYGYLRINNIVSKVASVVSSTLLQLETPLTYAADQAAGTGFTLYRDTYTLPADFVMGENMMAETIWGALQYIPPAQWAAWVRFRESYGVPQFYTLMGDPDVPGLLCVRIFPFPDQDATLDFMYSRKPREMRVFDLSTGTATVDAINAPTTITLSQSVLSAANVGAVIRLSSTGSTPDGIDGLNPAVYEGNIVAVPSATTCTVDAAVPTSFAGVAYRVSDPIDLEDFAMLTAYVRCAEKHCAQQRLMKNAGQAAQAYDAALVVAKEADARIQARRSAGPGGIRRQRLRDMPGGPDIS